MGQPPHSVYAVDPSIFVYVSCASQNTFVPGVVELAEEHQVYIGGDDFKSGQTKMKSVMVDFLVSSGYDQGFVNTILRAA